MKAATIPYTYPFVKRDIKNTANINTAVICSCTLNTCCNNKLITKEINNIPAVINIFFKYDLSFTIATLLRI